MAADPVVLAFMVAAAALSFGFVVLGQDQGGDE